MRRPYYLLKPYLPLSSRIAFRRIRARYWRRRMRDTWPIDPNAAHRDPVWPGWPEGKQFAFVLTHDVEGPRGLERCKPLLELEKSFGFRGSFNFVPEGCYSVTQKLRHWVEEMGGEVGVHDLRHDGKLFWSRRRFHEQAQRINRYLKEWNAAGFRSGFMLRELDWLHDLNILYDASTFDTDPFEPEPTGVRTIFPFWVSCGNGKGYVELPYTLVQDFSLFVILREKSPELWKKKLDWIAEHGGMALIDTHPDYMIFRGDKKESHCYPIEYYREFLEYVATKYAGRFWQPLPREMATYVNGMIKATSSPPYVQTDTRNGHTLQRKRGKIWIDLDNTPHVPFFVPIGAGLTSHGYEVAFTARDAFQVCELADFHKVSYRCIGRHYGKNRINKVLGVFFRAAQLIPFVLKEKPALGLSHGSRAQMIACNLLGIPSILIADYEHAQMPPLMRPSWELAPQAIPDNVLHCRTGQVRKYSGIKEDVYAWTLVPDNSILKELSLDPKQIIVLVRPPATEAHYHNPQSEVLFEHVMDRLTKDQNTRVVLLPRNRSQEDVVRHRWPAWFAQGKVVVPRKAVDGLNLIWHSDLVISGGGTMNRESAALGVPVYSIFRGPIGAVDRQLAAEGRLTLITAPEDLQSKLVVRKREASTVSQSSPRRALDEIVGHIESILHLESQRNGRQ